MQSEKKISKKLKALFFLVATCQIKGFFFLAWFFLEKKKRKEIPEENWVAWRTKRKQKKLKKRKKPNKEKKYKRNGEELKKNKNKQKEIKKKTFKIFFIRTSYEIKRKQKKLKRNMNKKKLLRVSIKFNKILKKWVYFNISWKKKSRS